MPANLQVHLSTSDKWAVDEQTILYGERVIINQWSNKI